MCEAASIAAGIAAVVGAGMSYYGQQQQAAEYKRAQREQNAYAAAQRQLALNQQAEERKFGDEKNASILQEAEQVAPDRVQRMQAAEDKQAESNINALQQANLLGGDSIAATAEGRQSDEYLKARAETATRQTEQAIKLARLFGAQTAGQDAVATQMQGALDHRLNQQAIDARRRSMQHGYDWMFDDLSVRKAKAKGNYNPAKGAGLQAVGGAAMNIGMSGMGNYFGSSAGGSASGSAINSLF